MQLRDFAEREFAFDRRSGRYRIRSGAGKGQFISREAILALTRGAIAQNKIQLVNLADELDSESINLRDFQLQAARLLRMIHIQQAAIAAGGVEQITPEEWLSVARRLKQQYYAGRDYSTNKRYGIKWLAKDIREGKVSLAQLRQRLGLYANSGIETFWDIQARKAFSQGAPYAIRHLGATDDHCPQCPQYAALPPQPVTSVIRPTQSCDCKNNCRCRLEFLSFEDAVRLGAVVA